MNGPPVMSDGTRCARRRGWSHRPGGGDTVFGPPRDPRIPTSRESARGRETARCTWCTQAGQGAGLRTRARRHPPGWRVARRSLNVKGATALVTGVRLSMCGLLRGVRTTSRESDRVDRGEREGTFGTRQRADVGRVRKRDEPHDRQRDATSPRSSGGASRRGGGKPRGRNTNGSVGTDSPKADSRSSTRKAATRREWTPGCRASARRTSQGDPGFGQACLAACVLVRPERWRGERGSGEGRRRATREGGEEARGIGAAHVWPKITQGGEELRFLAGCR